MKKETIVNGNNKKHTKTRFNSDLKTSIKYELIANFNILEVS